MKVLVTPRSFAKTDGTPLKLLTEHGFTVVTNPTGSILTEDQLAEALYDCDGVILGVDPLTADVIAKAPRLKAVAKYGVGVDNIDLDACSARGIAVSKTIGANSDAVADYAFGLMLALARKIIPIDARCRRSDWGKITTSDVFGKTLGLIGLGAIGRRVVKRAKGFSMKVLAYDVVWDEAYAGEEGIEKVDIDAIMSRCDFISLHLPLMDSTRRIIGADRIGLMKPTAFLINTARGGLIDDEALIAALKNNRIAGAGLDAFEQEPPENKDWFTLDNAILGSHCAASTIGASEAMSRIAAENLIADLSKL